MEVQFLELFSEIVENENAVKMDDLLTDFEEWDSLAVLSVISMLDDEYGVIMGSKDMKKMKTVGDIFSFVMNAVK